jgi:phosphoglycolate phosphatase-like HAD superfamily hydrolase
MSIGRSNRIRPWALAALLSVAVAVPALAQTDPLPSWNDGAAKKAILEFVQATTTQGSPKFVPPAARIAVFDQDGTTWVEQPMYAQVIYCLERVAVLAKAKPELKDVEPFKTVLSGDREAMAKLTMPDLEKILAATLSGMTVEQFGAEVKDWLATARHPRFKRPYTDLVYQPMLEVMGLFRANGYKTYFVTGGGQDFVRVYSEQVYGVPPEQVVGSAGGTRFGYDKAGRPMLTKEPKLLLNDDKAGKPDQAGEGARLMVLVHHDDGTREFAYGAKSKVGTFPEALMAQAQKRGWVVISMKNDWKRVFAFE